MPKNAPIPVPDPAAALQWLIENPQAARLAIQSLNLILGLQVRLTQAGLATFNQQQSLLISGEVIQLPLPLLWPAGVPSGATVYSGGTAGAGYSQAQMQAVITALESATTKLNLILAGERAVQG